MGWLGGRLVFFLILGLSSFLVPAFATGFSDCFSQGALARFWSNPPYISSNPNIITIWSMHSYSFSFDNSTESLGLDGIELENGSAILSQVPLQYRSSLSEPAALLSQASSELVRAKEEKSSAHDLSIKAQAAVRDNFGIQNAPLTNIFFLAPLVHLNTLLKALDISNYVGLYPAKYSSALEHSAKSYDLAQSAALSISSLVQSEYAFLSHAGAFSQSYSGFASAPFNYAESLLSPDSSLCASESAASSQLAAYFSSSPQMPDFSQPSFSARANSLAGASQNSTINRLISLYILLSDSKGKMLSEYESARAGAEGALRSLSLEVSLLDSGKLEFIGDVPFSQQSGSSLLVGSEYSGIYSGYLKAKDDLARSESILQSAQSSFSSKGANGYLATAIADAQSSAEISQNAISSLRLVRSNAESAVLSQENTAQIAISIARNATSGQATTISSAQSLSAARILLSQSEAEFTSAKSMPQLGARFLAYSNAARLADRATSLSQSEQDFSISLEAEAALSGYSVLIYSAEKDGLDVSYDKEMLLEYRSLIAASQSPDISSSVQGAVLHDSDALVLRLHEKYSYLEEKYSLASAYSSAMHTTFPSISQQLGRLSQYFPSGELDARAAVGSLKQIERSLDALLAEAGSKTPIYLSSVLSQQAQVFEIQDMIVLGQQTDYVARLTTQNPSQLFSSGEISFSTVTSVPLYSSDFSGGDAIVDAYPENGKVTVVVPAVSPWQSFSSTFKKKDNPVQIVSSIDSCETATAESAGASRAISFISSRAIPSIKVSQQAPPFSYGASALYGGLEFPLSFEDVGLLQGEISGIFPGKGSLMLNYFVPMPFSVSSSDLAYETLPLGAKKITQVLEISQPLLDCAAANVLIFEPYAGISNLSIVPLSGEKVAHAAAVPSGNETRISFEFSPLAKGRRSSFAVSYILQDQQAALSFALSQAELMVLTYNRTKDSFALANAKNLALQGKSNEALTILSQMRQDAQALSYSAGDYQMFLSEKADAEGKLSSLLFAQDGLSHADAKISTQFSSMLFKYQSSISSANDEADAGGYQKATTILRKAKGDIYSSLATLSLFSLNEAAESYATARKENQNANASAMLSAKGSLEESQSSYTDGEFAQSLLQSSQASRFLSLASESASATSAQISADAEQLRFSYAALRTGAESLLANYSSQYSALSTQSRRQLSFTPSAAQVRLDEADKQIAASKKTSLSPQEALSQANASLAKISALGASLTGALSSLSGSASSSLDVARAALSEVKLRADVKDAQQIGEEVAKSEDFLASGLYADSLSSSERAISAANAALSKTTGTNPLQPLALAIISVVFICGAAYYFFMGKKRAPPSEKKEVPKAE
jgi:hypothetical protein